MHEFGVAVSIVERVRHIGFGVSKITKVGLRLGDLAGLDREILLAAFAALTEGTPLQGISLEIDSELRVQKCSGCAREIVESCASYDSAYGGCVVRDDLDLAFVEFEEAGLG